jgi:hypothetical protein
VERALRLTLEEAPRGVTHGSSRALATRTGLSQSTVSRIWRAFGLRPHRTEIFELPNDPLLVDKVRDIVGLYMNPTRHAIVLRVDEKSRPNDRAAITFDSQIDSRERADDLAKLRLGKRLQGFSGNVSECAR